MFQHPEDYAYVSLLEAQWQKVQAEALRLDLDHFTNWPEKFLYDSGWRVFGLYGFGRKLERNCELCPETTALIEQIDGLVTAGFSKLEPRTHIRPHCGYTNQVLRCHLPLKVPALGRCELRVGHDVRAWQLGHCLVFDDTTEHEAWNDTEEDRIVLLMDVKRDPKSGDVKVPEGLLEQFKLS